MGLYRPLSEHIRLAFEIPLIIKYLKGTQKEVAFIGGKGKIIPSVVDKTVFLGERIIEPIKVFLFGAYHFFGVVIGLVLDKVAYTVPYLKQPFDTVFRRHGERGGGHAVILSEVNLTVYQSIGEVPHIRVGGDGVILLIGNLVDFAFVLWYLAAYPLHGFVKQLGKGSVLVCFAGRLQLPEAGAFHLHLAKHHFWVLHKIAVHGDAVRIGIKVNPVWLGIYHSVTLLQNEDVACDLRAGIGTERVVGQPYRTQQLGSLGDIPPYLWACLIHRTLGSDEHHHAACAYLIQSFCKEIIVDKEFLGVVAAVIYLKFPKRHIAKYHIKVVVWEFGILKALHGNFRFLVKLLCDFACQRVDFHAVEFRACHAFGQKPEEITRAAGRL